MASNGGPADGASARYVLTVLIDDADADGRSWYGHQALLSQAGIKDRRTLRRLLDGLVKEGWLRIVPQTWASLTAEQAALGRPLPRRDDAGQATNLYIVLKDGGRKAPRKAPSRPGLARISTSTPSTEVSMETPQQICPGGPVQNDPGGPPANLHPDLDHIEDLPKEESAERATPVDPGTHISSSSQEKRAEKLEAWDVIVEAHAEKTTVVYGLPPLPPDVKRDMQKALAASLDGAAAEVRAKLLERTGTERDIVEVRRELAARVMHLYFKRDNEHLRKVKHALRDLPREFHARIIEAMQALLRESHDAAPARRVQLEQPVERIEPADKPVETAKVEKLEQPVERVESADKPVEVATVEKLEPLAERVEPTDKPAKTETHTQQHVRSLQRPPAPTDAAREAKRILDMLNASPQEDLFKQPKAETAPPAQPKRPELPEWMRAELEQTRASVDKPAENKPVRESFERKQSEDKPSPASQHAPHVDRLLGRSGAPRWGDIGPRPTKVRRVSRLLPDELESEKEHVGGSTPQT